MVKPCINIFVNDEYPYFTLSLAVRQACNWQKKDERFYDYNNYLPLCKQRQNFTVVGTYAKRSQDLNSWKKKPRVFFRNSFRGTTTNAADDNFQRSGHVALFVVLFWISKWRQENPESK